MAKDPNLTNYKRDGVVNGKAVHSWQCMGCPWHATRIGGVKAKNSGQGEADRHQCYDSSKDAQKGRKDLE